jgi:UTP--glucose-1-phosphate uridylyltransferase
VDKPLIQYAVEEAIAAGLKEMIFVTGRSKRAIEDHFDKNHDLEIELGKRGKTELLVALDRLPPPDVSCVYTRQPEALGLGHAVLCAAPMVGDEPFAVLLADDLIHAETPVLAQMTELHERYGCSILGVERVAPADTRFYGIVAAEPAGERLWRVTGIVEKPAPNEAPSTLAVVGRYILTQRIFDLLRRVRPGAGGEIQLTDAIGALLAEEPVLAYEFEGTRYDCGSKLGYLKATVNNALHHPEVSDAFRAYLLSMSRDLAGRAD